MSEFNVVFLLTHCLLDFHFSGGPVQGPHELSLAKFVVSCDKSSRSDDLVPHLLQRVEHVEGRGGKFNPPVFLVFVLRQGRRLFRQNPKLVKRKSVHCAAEKQTFCQASIKATICCKRKQKYEGHSFWNCSKWCKCFCAVYMMNSLGSRKCILVPTYHSVSLRRTSFRNSRL